MKFKALAIASLSLVASLATAGTLSDTAYNVADQIRESEYDLTTSQRAEINRDLNRILRALRNDLPGDEYSSSYVCVSRDNDGRNPWIIGEKNGVQITRLAGTVFSTKDECETALAKARRTSAGLAICASRDNDGRNPMTVMILTGTAAKKLPNSTQPDGAACEFVLRNMKVSRKGILYCTSRDNDGRSPFIQMSYQFDGQSARGGDTYSSMADCQATL